MDGIVNVAILIHVCGQVEGRKKLQKMVYILQAKGYPFREQFSYHHYGPYSSQLKREIDLLVREDSEVVSEDADQTGPYSAFKYSAGNKMESFLKIGGATSEPEWASLAKELNKKCAQELEAISTVLFLRDRGFADKRLEDRFRQLKPDLASDFDATRTEAERLVPCT